MANTQYRASIRGRRNRASGIYWEQIISNACYCYQKKGLAEISKTPEPMRILRKPDSKGHFLACFTKKAQPDYKGTMRGGRAIVFEAKHTDSDKMQRSVISDKQEQQLDSHLKLGALCYVLVSFGLERFFFVPWPVFKDMKKTFGRKYIRPNDVEGYEVKMREGYLHFLGD